MKHIKGLIFGAALLGMTPASADSGPPAVAPASARPAAMSTVPYVDPDFRYDLRIELPIVGIGLGAWIATEVSKPQIGPQTCRVCERAPDGTDTLNGLDAGVRRLLVSGNTGVPDQISNVTGFGLIPLSMLGLGALSNYQQGSIKQGLVDLLIVAEATVLAVDVNQLVKFTVGRERPFVHVLPEAEKSLVKNAADNNLSFFSGHTTLSFAWVTATGTVASLRRYKLAPLIWAVGIPIATLTGILRISADRHYFTDVITGAAIGSAMGFLGPWLHRKQKTTMAIYPLVTSSRTMGIAGQEGVTVGLLWSGVTQ